MQRRNDWVQLTTEFENSGLTQVEFAKRRGIKLTTFRQGYSAARKRLRQDAAQQPVRFVPVKVGEGDRGRTRQLFEVRVSLLSLRFEVGTEGQCEGSLLSPWRRAC